MDNVGQTLASQYANSPVLRSLIESLNSAIDPAVSIDAFETLVLDVTTAVGYGLDVWGRIVGVGRVVQIPVDIVWLGFSESGPGSAETFGFGQFYTPGLATTKPYTLTNAQFRTLILAKALANICDGSIPAINQILLNLFVGRGNAYVVDRENMSIAYTFAFALTTVEQAILSQSGVLPTPNGVFAIIISG